MIVKQKHPKVNEMNVYNMGLINNITPPKYIFDRKILTKINTNGYNAVVYLVFSYYFVNLFKIGEFFNMRKLHHPVTPEVAASVKSRMKNRIDPIKPKVFVGYPFIIAIMAVLQVMTVIYDDKYFVIWGLNVSAGWFILMPVMLYLFQIVAEVYGWQYARQIIWCNFTVNILMTTIIFAFKYIPFSSSLNHEDIKSAFITLMDNDKLIDMPPMLGAMLVSDLITSSLMAWSKFHWNGRHVMIRILCLHFVSEIIILSTSFIAQPLTGYTLAETWLATRDCFIARTIIMIALLPVARLVIYWLQNKVDDVIVFDYKTSFAPFKFRINPEDSVQFSATGWQTVDSRNIDIKKLASTFYDEHLDKTYQKPV
jgi:uncharacterized PurR-regulated membrane protein YhhQ (DUF165 family)